MSKKPKNFRIGRFESLEERIVFSVEYFVDSVHGNDDNDGLSPTTAMRTVEKLVSQYESLKPQGHIELAPGDIVTLMPGEHQFAYRYGEGQWQGLFLRNVHGTASQPITIRGMDGAKINNRAPDGTEMSSIDILQSSHIRVENLDITSYGSAVFVADASDVTIRDNYIHDVDGIAANNLSGVYVVGAKNLVIENNLFTDNYDRQHPGNPNNRHIVIFGGADVKVLRNTMRNENPNAGMAVDYKHLGGLPPGQVGQYEVAYNTIINAAGTAIGTAAPNSYIHHNLLIDSGSIRVADLGGTAQLANERIEYNTIINNRAQTDGGGLSYYPTEYDGHPLGDLYWSHNLVVDNRLYDHSEKSTLLVDRYGSDQFYKRVFPGGLFHAEGNVYQTRDVARFDLYGANGGHYGELGSYLNFAQWQAAGYDRTGSISSVNVDETFRDKSNSDQRAGLYADNAPRLTAILSQLDIDESGGNSTTRLRIVRSGPANSQALRVALSVSQKNEIDLPNQVIIPPGVNVIELDIRGMADSLVDLTEALQIIVAADGFSESSTWVRLHDSPAGGSNDGDGGDNDGDPNDEVNSPSGIYQVPGDAGDRVRLQSAVNLRWAAYDNEMGIAYVDDAQGRVGDLLPSDAGWVQALMSRGQSMTVLRSGVGQGDVGKVELVAGRYFVFTLVQDSSIDKWRSLNSENELGKEPLLFTSVTSSNPDRFNHVHQSAHENSIDLAWEDLTFGGDLSFTDLVVLNTFESAEQFGQAIDDAFRVSATDGLELNVLANDHLPVDAKVSSVTQPEFGSVQISATGDKLVYQPEPNRYGLVHFSYTVAAIGQTTSANVELAIAKSWTNLAAPTDVNHDGRVSALDALLVINALHQHGELVLPDYPEGKLASLNTIDVDGDQRLTITDALLVIVDVLARNGNS